MKLISELGRFPGLGDLRLKRHQDPTFPSHNTFNRFAAKRRHGEWFELDAADVGAFKRRKFM